MNLKISISVLVAFVVVFSFLFFLDDAYPKDIHYESFFSNIPTEKNIIYLIGSSHVAMLNTHHMNNVVKELNLDYEIYNIAYNGNRPSSQIDQLSKLIATKPELVIYGVSYREFSSINPETDNIENILPDPKQLKNEIFSGININEMNPKLLTLKILTSIFPALEENEVEIPNTPFISFNEADTKIRDDTKLLKTLDDPAVTPQIYHIDPSTNNPEVNSFKKIIQEFEKNEIKLVIFAPPLHRIYLDHISDSEEENFKKIIEDAQNELYFPNYDFSYKYADLPIWTDLTHVAVDNEKSLTYTDDVLKIIFEEINH